MEAALKYAMDAVIPIDAETRRRIGSCVKHVQEDENPNVKVLLAHDARLVYYDMGGSSSDMYEFFIYRLVGGEYAISHHYGHAMRMGGRPDECSATNIVFAKSLRDVARYICDNSNTWSGGSVGYILRGDPTPDVIRERADKFDGGHHY